MKRIGVLLLMFCLVTGIAGCAEKKNGEIQADNGLLDYNTMTVDDSSELPSWEGKHLSLNVWYAHGTSTGMSQDDSQFGGDVVWPEVERVTGVSIDFDNSFDNGMGQTFDTKLGMLAATNDWPDLIVNAANLKTLVDNDKIYDLTELIPKYCPNIMRRIPLECSSVWQTDARVSAGIEGKIYAFPTGLYEGSLSMLNPDLDVEAYSEFAPPAEPKGYVWVRDDILKAIFPDAKSQDELQQIFNTNGKFTEKDVLDSSFNSKQEFIDFLYQVKKLGIKENGREVWPIYVYSGQDNWQLLSGLSSDLDGRGSQTNYFTYWDRQTQSLKYLFKQPDFKQTLLDWNKLVREGIASPESLVDSSATFTEKANSGQYAVLYQTIPDNASLEAQGKSFKYRKVYLNIDMDDSKYTRYELPPYCTTNIAIFKDSVAEEDLPQVLTWLDFMVSETGEKLVNWGPKSAGLWEEKDGVRTFKDKELEDELVYFEEPSKSTYYNLVAGNSSYYKFRSPLITFIRNGANPSAPAIVTEKDPSRLNMEKYFSLGFFEDANTVLSAKPDFWNYTSTISQVDKAWKARKAFEDALLKTLTASDDANFELLYNDFLNVAEKNGYDDECLKLVDEAFRESNKDYMSNLIAGGTQ